MWSASLRWLEVGSVWEKVNEAKFIALFGLPVCRKWNFGEVEGLYVQACIEDVVWRHSQVFDAGGGDLLCDVFDRTAVFGILWIDALDHGDIDERAGTNLGGG